MDSIEVLAIRYKPGEGSRKCKNCYQYKNGNCLMWGDIKTDPDGSCGVFIIDKNPASISLMQE